MDQREQQLRLTLEELKQFALGLTDGSLMKVATLQVIAEHESRRYKNGSEVPRNPTGSRASPRA